MPFPRGSVSLFAGKSSLSQRVWHVPAGTALPGAPGGARLVGLSPSVRGGSSLLRVSLGGFWHLGFLRHLKPLVLGWGEWHN